MYFYLMTPMGSSGEATDPRYVLMRQSRPSFLIAKQLQFQNRWWFTWDLNPGRRMVGSDETTELWRPSIQDILVPIHTRLLRLLSRIKHYGPWALVNPIKTIMVRGLKRTGCGYRLPVVVWQFVVNLFDEIRSRSFAYLELHLIYYSPV